MADSIIQFPLDKGLVTLIDATDLALVEGYTWRSWWNKCTKSFYAVRYKGGRVIYMHRVILDAPKGMTVDHRNHDTLNNTRNNIRLATHSQNRLNMRMQSRNTSGFKGVSFCKQTGKWTAKTKVNGKFIWLGRHDTVEDAAKAYERGADEYHGEFRYRGGGAPLGLTNGTGPNPECATPA